jgi:hypothetical protein
MEQLRRAEYVARMFDCSQMTVYNLVKSGTLKAVVFRTRGGRDTYRFRVRDIEAFILGNLRADEFHGRPGGAG